MSGPFPHLPAYARNHTCTRPPHLIDRSFGAAAIPKLISQELLLLLVVRCEGRNVRSLVSSLLP